MSMCVKTKVSNATLNFMTQSKLTAKRIANKFNIFKQRSEIWYSFYIVTSTLI